MRTLDKPWKGARGRFLADQPIPCLDVWAQAHLAERRRDARKGPLLSGTSHPRELEKGELWSSQHIPVPLLNCSIPTGGWRSTFSTFTPSPGAAGRDDHD